MKGASDGLERLKRLEGRHACLASDDAESGHGEGTREARESIHPIARQCVFVRHACRVEDLPSRSRKGDHHSAGQWFLDLKKDPGRA